jgi:hypothetical protein
MSQRQIVITVVASALALLVLWTMMSAVLLGPRAELSAEIADVRTAVENYSNGLRRSTDVVASIRDYASRTLGADVETVDHRLRTRLNRIAEAVGLDGPAVNTGNPTARRSPARTAFSRRGSWKTLRDTVDFVELDGSVSGEGTLQQALELVDRIEAEPWIKRIGALRLEPKGNEDRFSVTVRLTTLFIPGRAPEPIEPAPYDRTRLDRYATLAAGGPFLIPAAASPPPAVAAEQTQAPRPRFPWGQWMLTGIAEGPQGPEVWLRNHKSGETRQLTVGGALHEARLLAIAEEWAEFELGATRFRLEVGRRFSDRSAVSE